MGKRAIYYDTETTGVRFKTDSIIEIAAYDPAGDKSFCSFINPKVPIPAEATAIHNITDEMVANAPEFPEVISDFFAFCGEDAVLIAHNNDAFDKPFLEEECRKFSVTMPSLPSVDTLKWARKYRPDLPRHSLQYLREVYSLEANNAHRALDDVIILEKVFSRMIDDLTIEQVLELLSQPSVVSRMPFGKHKGKPLEEVPKDYLRWLADSGAFDKPGNSDLKKSLEDLGLLQESSVS